VTHLSTTYGQLKAAELEINRAKLATQWNPDKDIENLWKRITVIRDAATAGAGPISDRNYDSAYARSASEGRY
jgi:hypothetical protein